MEEPDTQYGPVKRGWYGDGEQTAMATETERKGVEVGVGGVELRGKNE